MSFIRRKEIKIDTEERILTGMIVSDKVLNDTVHMIKKDTFQNPYTQTIAKWVQEYHKQYRKAPRSHIQDIYNIEKNKLKEEDAILIADFLSRLSKKFESEEKFNDDYLIDKARQFFKKRTLQNIHEKMGSLLELDKVDEAEKEMQGYKKLSVETSKVINLMSEEELKKFFRDEENETNKLFRMDGKLGELIGDFERGTLVGVMAPAKRGKSFLLMEIAMQAYFQKLNVLFISLEMDEFRIKRRFIKRMTALGNEPKEYIYPCFDCFKNQIDKCNNRKRTNHERLRDVTGKFKPEFDPKMSYKPCTICRGTKDFIPDTWFTVIWREKRTLKKAKKIFEGVRNSYGEGLRILCYPKFSTNISRIKADIETLEFNEEFIPDVIVIDYVDILAPEDSRVAEGRDRVNDSWKMCGNLADTRRALVVTASQANRKSFTKQNVTDIDVAEDIRKIANVEVMLSLSQTPDEKKAGVTRVSVVAGRDDDFNQYKSCLVLQNLALGQSCLDTEIVASEEQKKRIEGEENDM